MKPTSVIVLISAVALFVTSAYAEQAGPGMGQQQGAAAVTKDPKMVSQIQQALNNKGYDAGTADGNWGSKTQQALQSFQKAQGIEATGQPDQQTLAALGVSPEGAAAGGPQGDMEGQQDRMSDQQSGGGSNQ